MISKRLIYVWSTLAKFLLKIQKKKYCDRSLVRVPTTEKDSKDRQGPKFFVTCPNRLTLNWVRSVRAWVGRRSRGPSENTDMCVFWVWDCCTFRMFFCANWIHKYVHKIDDKTMCTRASSHTHTCIYQNAEIPAQCQGEHIESNYSAV